MLSAERANFFSLARTFSLPGMTTYSDSKSLSVSTPRVLLGRSLTWPSEASTVKPLPRYFWMVFALAGDSTMTKPFSNGVDCVPSLFRSYHGEQEMTKCRTILGNVPVLPHELFSVISAGVLCPLCDLRFFY